MDTKEHPKNGQKVSVEEKPAQITFKPNETDWERLDSIEQYFETTDRSDAIRQALRLAAKEVEKRVAEGVHP